MSLTVLGVASIAGIATGLGEQKGQIIVNKNAFKPQLSLKNGFNKIVKSIKESWLLFLKAGILAFGLAGYFYLLLRGGLNVLTFEALISTKFFLLSFSILFFAYFVCAVLDFIFQKRRHYLDLRMDDQEVRDEYKELEGDPFIKNALQERQFELLADAIENAVKNAKVVVTAKNTQ
ncbi:MAG: hypothetical protein D6780_06865 [Candidatus Dadabacteria bacterium]|nr:MAG: hypothetical protein D6780_06865 [Candidatus Dadabacteria bacterium]